MRTGSGANPAPKPMDQTPATLTYQPSSASASLWKDQLDVERGCWAAIDRLKKASHYLAPPENP